MTISSTIRKAGPFVGSGSASAFPFAFKVFTAADVLVVRTDTALGADTNLVMGTDYTVSLNADQNANPGGTVTLTAGALATGFNLTITSSLAYLQPTDLTNQGGFYPSVITNALDRLTIFAQQLYDAVSRSLKISVTTPAGVSTTLPVPASNKIIGWNAAADALQNVDPTTMASIVAFGTANADQFTGNGVTTTFALSANPAALNNLDVSIGGVTQRPTADYTWTSGTTLTFTSAPANGAPILVRYMQALPQGTTTAAQVSLAGGGVAEDFTSAAAAKGADLVGFSWANTPVSQAVAAYGIRTAARGYNILRDIAPANWAAITAGTYTTDLASVIVAAASAGREVYLPAGTYYVSTANFGNVSNLRIVGDGQGATLIKPLTTGAASEPTFKFSATSSARVTLEGIGFIGNGLSGASGNGNAISFINAAGTGFAPQLLTLRDVYIEGFQGTGKDNAGASMPSAGIYGYLGTSAHFENVSVYSCAQAMALNGYQKVYAFNFITDFSVNRGLYLVNCENVDFFGGIFNRCGSGGTTDGSIVPQGCANLNFYGTRFKDANPCHLNSRSTTFLNRDMTFFGCDWNQLAGVNTMIDCGTGDSGLKIKGGRWKWDSSVTAGVGVNVGNGPGGYQMTGLLIEDVLASIGSGGTIANLVLINNSTGVVHAPRIRGLQFGDGSSAGSATAVTNGVHLSGIIDSPIIEGLNLHAATNYTVTNAINIDAAGGNLINPVIIAPVYRTTGGTITNQLVNTTGAVVTLIASGVAASGNVRANAASAGVAGSTTIGATTATTVGAAGAASALPANPLGYIIGHVGTTQVKIPYYNN